MNEQVKAYLDGFPAETAQLFWRLRQLVLEGAAVPPEEKLWARLPSYYVGEKFVRLIPFKDHINIEARTMPEYKEELSGWKMTPKGMLQVFVKQELPAETLKKVFAETLQ